jgi:hypothetical protein
MRYIFLLVLFTACSAGYRMPNPTTEWQKNSEFDYFIAYKDLQIKHRKELKVRGKKIYEALVTKLNDEKTDYAAGYWQELTDSTLQYMGDAFPEESMTEYQRGCNDAIKDIKKYDSTFISDVMWLYKIYEQPLPDSHRQND